MSGHDSGAETEYQPTAARIMSGHRRRPGARESALALWFAPGVHRFPIVLQVQVSECLLQETVIDARLEVERLFDQTIALGVLNFTLVLRDYVVVDQRARLHLQRLRAPPHRRNHNYRPTNR